MSRGHPPWGVLHSSAFFFPSLPFLSSAGWLRQRRRGTGTDGEYLFLFPNGRCIKHSRRLCWWLDTYIHRIWRATKWWALGQVTDKRTPPLSHSICFLFFSFYIPTKKLHREKKNKKEIIFFYQNVTREKASPQVFRFVSLYDPNSSSHRRFCEMMRNLFKL